MNAPRLELRGVALGYDGTVFARDIDLTVNAGEIVAVLGPSGSGKSTLLGAIAGVVPPVAGQVLIDGTDVTGVPIERRRVGLIFQEPLLFAHLSVVDNVAYGLRRAGVDRTAARARAGKLLEWVGLPGFGARRTDQLSGGQAQRVALARALAAEPSVLLLDEPFSALDADLRERLAAEVSASLRAAEVAAVHVTHDADEARVVADRVLSMPDLARPADQERHG